MVNKNILVFKETIHLIKSNKKINDAAEKLINEKRFIRKALIRQKI